MGLGNYFQFELVLDPWAANPHLGEMSPHQGDGNTVRKAFRINKTPTPAPFSWVSCSHHYTNPLTCPCSPGQTEQLCPDPPRGWGPASGATSRAGLVQLSCGSAGTCSMEMQ